MALLEKGQCFSFKFSEDNTKGYFFTGELDDDGNMIMCEMLPEHEINFTSLWRMSERFFENYRTSGRLIVLD